MKIAKSVAMLAGFVIGGLNVSGQTMNSEQIAWVETAEMERYVTGVTPEESTQILTIEQDYAKRMQDSQNTVTGVIAMNTQNKELWNIKHAKIKTILTAEQFKQYKKIEKIEKYNLYHNSRWLNVYYVHA